MDDFREYKIGRIHTYPKNLEIADIDNISRSHGGIVIIPTYYNCEIFLSIYVIQRILRWTVKNNYVLLDGCITVPIGNRKEVYNDPAEKEDDAPQTSTSLSTPNENGSVTS